MNAFPLRDNCPVPQIDAIEGNLVESCVVPEAPQACPEVPIILFPPPSFNFGCYAPGLAVSSKLTHDSPKFFGGISYPNKFETGNCQPVFNFSVEFACESPKVSARIVSYTSPKFTAKVGQSTTSSGTCDPKFDFEIGFPCTYPSIKAGVFMWKPPGDDPSEIKLKLVISLVGSSISSQVCEWGLKSEVDPVCPKFDPGDTIQAEWDDTIDDPVINIFDILFDDGAFVPEDHCPYVYDLDIKIPPLMKLDEDRHEVCAEGECPCCEPYQVLVRTDDTYPSLEIVDNHKILLHYAYRNVEDFKLAVTSSTDGTTHHLTDGPVVLMEEISPESGDCTLCGDNTVSGNKTTIDAGGIDCTLIYVCWISKDRFGAVTAHYAQATYKNGILTAISTDAGDPGECTGCSGED